MADAFFTRAPSTIVTIPLTGQLEFTIPFEFLARKFVVVTLLGTDRKVLNMGTDYRFIAVNKIQLARQPDGSYTRIELRRVTSATDRLVTFIDGSILRATDLNLAQVQTMHVAEEARDMTTDNIGVNDDGDLDARNRKIVNLADAENDLDAVNLKQLRQFDSSTANNADKAARSAAAAKVSETNAANSEDRCVVAEAKAISSAGTAMTAAADANRSKVSAKQSEDKAADILADVVAASGPSTELVAKVDKASADAASSLQASTSNTREIETLKTTKANVNGPSFTGTVYSAGNILSQGAVASGHTSNSPAQISSLGEGTAGNWASQLKCSWHGGGVEVGAVRGIGIDCVGLYRTTSNSKTLDYWQDVASGAHKFYNNAGSTVITINNDGSISLTGSKLAADGNIFSANYYSGSLIGELNSNKQWRSFDPTRCHGWTSIGNGYLELIIDGKQYGMNMFLSDSRLKENVKETEVHALSVIDKFKMVDFSWGNEATFQTGNVSCGLIAQDVLEVSDQYVTGCSDPEKGYYQLHIQNLLTLSMKAIQELRAEVNSLRQQVNSLTKE